MSKTACLWKVFRCISFITTLRWIETSSSHCTKTKAKYLRSKVFMQNSKTESNITEAVPLKVFCKKSFLKKIRNTHRKAPVLESLFNKVAGLNAWRPATLLKRESNTGCFPVSIANFFKKNFFYRTPSVGLLLLYFDSLLLFCLNILLLLLFIRFEHTFSNSQVNKIEKKSGVSILTFNVILFRCKFFPLLIENSLF